ncbi:MAG TPA: aminotransferase class V-fold PLP-dependent enzyme [Bellilinea sp.]|nr:aminotransferase class V-fold PLP-dependent enzyme [Bellilinea sp.]
MPRNRIYLDNAATSWPKPPQMLSAMQHFSADLGANPGRSGHSLSVDSARVIFECREQLAALFNATQPERVIFGLNATDGINLALYGQLQPGDHVITSSMEHNAVMRPLQSLVARGVQVTEIECYPDGTLDAAKILPALRGNTKMLIFTHASNVCGTLLPIRKIGEIAHNNGLLLMVDAAQTAGSIPIDMQADNIDLLAFTGHKGLYGPMGTGGLILGDRVDVSQMHSIRQGGTGSHSGSMTQPEFLPDKFESGTLNAIGIAGLNASIGWLMERGIQRIQSDEQMLTAMLLDGLSAISGVKIYGTRDPQKQTAVVALNIKSWDPADAGTHLEEDFGILCRIGLHCAPAAHRTLNSFPRGSIRFSLSRFSTPEEIEKTVAAVAALAKEVF